MSEERIKERCKREDIALKVVKGFLEKDCYTDTELYYSLNTILDLYNKQKEELETEKHYAKVYENMVKDYEKICIEKNKKIEELEEEIDQISKNKWEDWLEANE